jgi:hypothetical protein
VMKKTPEEIEAAKAARETPPAGFGDDKDD